MSAETAHSFWEISQLRGRSKVDSQASAFAELVDRVLKCRGTVLFDALEVGVPTVMVDIVAGAMSQSHSKVLRMIGVTPATLRRRMASDAPLPPLAGHRVMALLRVAATMRRTLDKVGEPSASDALGRHAWLAGWLMQHLGQLGGRTPAELLRNPEGLRVLEHEIERIWNELPAWRQAQDAFLLRARDAVEISAREDGGISPRELLMRIDERIDRASRRTGPRSEKK